VEQVFYPEMEEAPAGVLPGATDVVVHNHDVFDKDYKELARGCTPLLAGS
jgi:hypothetical protein